MFTIVEHKNNGNLGMGFRDFVQKFDIICQNHIAQKRAKAFAFIFYDFENYSLKQILEDEVGVRELDRLSGKDITIFYFHSESAKALKKFNHLIIQSLDLNHTPLIPAVVFFKVDNYEVTDIKLVELIEENFLSTFSELNSIIKEFIQGNNKPIAGNKINTLCATVKKVAVEQFFKVIFEKFYKEAGM